MLAEVSTNDLLEADLTPIFVIFVVSILIAIIGILIVKAKNFCDNNACELKTERNAKIITRRSSPIPASPTVMVNTVVFELQNGSRVELTIKNQNTFGIMVEGDCGTLKYQGKRFIDFERNA